MGLALRPDVARELHTWRLASLLGLMLLPAVVSIVWGMGKSPSTKSTRDDTPATRTTPQNPAENAADNADTFSDNPAPARIVTIDAPERAATSHAETPGRHDAETPLESRDSRHNGRTRSPAGRSSTPR